MKPLRVRPTQVWVGPFPYRVEYNDAAIDNICVREQKDVIGHTDHRAITITIRESMSEQQIRDTLLHEILHCIFGVSGLYERKEPTEEEIVSSIAPTLVWALRVNRELVEYLTYED